MGNSFVLFYLWYSWKFPEANSGRDPFNQTFRKFRSKTQWIGSVQPEKFRKNGSTFWGGPLFPVGLVGILVEWIAPSLWENRSHTKSCYPVGNSHLPMGKTASVIPPVISLQHVMSTGCSASFWLTVTKIRVCHFCIMYPEFISWRICFLCLFGKV